MDYLHFIYKLGFTENNYNKILNEDANLKNLIINL
jgi:hypothetical protein